jgi:integrase/recombinase XerD
MNVSDAITDYLLDQGHLEKSSLTHYRQELRVFAKWCECEQITLEAINNRVIQAFLAWLKEYSTSSKHDREQISSRTIGNYVQNIITFLHWCLRDEEYSAYVTFARVKLIKKPRQEKILKETFTEAEIAALFEACRSQQKRWHEYQLRDEALLSLLLDTGIRAQELRTLTIGHVTLATDPDEDSYIKVMGKGRKEREIPIGRKTRRILSRYLRQYRQDAKRTNPVFVSRQSGGRLTHSGLKEILLRLKRFSSLSEDANVNPHKFRHTYSARFIQQGGDIYTLSRLLGHNNVGITERYLTTLGVDIGRLRSHRANYISIVDSLK